MKNGTLEKTVVALLENGSKLQAPAVAKYIDMIRRSHPDETPAQTIARLERIYLLAVTGSGTAAGATAAMPGVGTIASVATITAETAFFLEASALYTLAIAAVHGIAPEAKEQRRALVIAVVLGDAGMDIVERSVGHSAKNWGTLLATRVPGLAGMNDSLMKRFLVRFVTKRVALMAGKVIPMGIGAVIGGVGNRALGQTTIANAHKAFGPPPPTWPAPRHLVIEADPLTAIDRPDPKQLDAGRFDPKRRGTGPR
ncbi:hypothetical protein [Nocardia bovistercoris]|uniref:Di-and tripeptidase n=1 Tax=Nocardia bovistercoris TaxID=2785916 RepID=A0A931I8H1_9NOCA|nr:hypothetical protein [Nocardia bovistercoris]MBH0775843.1 hypothetical protein [Nocardia bovistercoris]